MSWSANKTIDPSTPTWQNDIDSIEVQVNENDEGVKLAQLHQVEWAKKTLVDAINNKIVGGQDRVYVATLSGHANPNHEPRSGWANDIVTVSIAQQSPPVRV